MGRCGSCGLVLSTPTHTKASKIILWVMWAMWPSKINRCKSQRHCLNDNASHLLYIFLTVSNSYYPYLPTSSPKPCYISACCGSNCIILNYPHFAHIIHKLAFLANYCKIVLYILLNRVYSLNTTCNFVGQTERGLKNEIL